MKAGRHNLSMERKTVTSSVIASVGYDAEARTLEIEFTTSRVYQYFLVPPEIYWALMSAESLGRYFNAEIRNRFPNREISESV